MNYTTKNNRVLEYEKSDSNISFKVNLPRTIEDELTGNGEGVWASCPENDYIYAIHHKGKIVLCEIRNDSVYFPNLKYGDLILVEFRNGEELRPVALLDELKHNYGEPISDEEKEKIMQKIFKIKELETLFPKHTKEEIVTMYDMLFKED